MNPKMIEEEAKATSHLILVGDAGLRGASKAVTSLISSSYAIRLFPVKWRSIREKLERLDSGLIAAASNNNSCRNSKLTELLDAISLTASEAQSLVHRCSDESYSGGKLHLRSDLDLIASKIDLHVKNLTEIYASGMLVHSKAIIVSKPSIGASREDMRFYMKDLLSRLRIGDTAMKTQALAAVNEILREDEKYVRILALETADSIGLLASLLESGDVVVVEEASEAVSVVAGFDSYRGDLVVAGVIAPLVRVLEVGSELGKERAARALKKLTENSNNAWSVSAHGGVPALLKTCGDACSNAELIGSACAILRNLSSVSEIKRFMVEKGVVSVLSKLSKSKAEAIQVQAIEFLHFMAYEDESVKRKAIKEGIIESLVNTLDPNSSHSSKAREIALRAIDGLCLPSDSSMNLLMCSAFLEQLLFFLKNGEISTQESTLKVVSHLSTISEETKKAIGDIGFIPTLVSLLEAKSYAVRETAAEVLCSLVSAQRNRRRFVQEEHNVSRILQLLDPEEEKSVKKKTLLLVIMTLTDSTSGRRKIVSSKYVKNLEKLAETNVVDAKKIIKKLSGNRFMNILSAMWSS